MLTDLQVENFKAWSDLKIEFGKITAIFGENSAGKSSLLQFLLMLKQTKNAVDPGLVLDFGGGPNELVDLGGYSDTVHRGSEDKADLLSLPDMQWSLTWTRPGFRQLRVPGRRRDEEGSPSALRGDTLRLTSHVGVRDQSRPRVSAESIEYEFADTTFCLRRKVVGSGAAPGGFELTCSEPELLESRRHTWYRRRPQQRPDKPLAGPVKTHLFPTEVRLQAPFLHRVLGQFEASYERLMDGVFYLGPLREHPRREYRWRGAGREGVGHRGEYTIDAVLSATERAPKEDLEGRIASRLKQLGLIESFSIREFAEGSGLYQTVVTRVAGGPETTLVDVGFGVSQVLPVLVLLYYVPPHSIVLVEQPELHLHPSIQSGLADVMLDVAQERHVQIVVESHSEHMLRRFQRRVAEGAFRASDVRLYFVGSAGGEAQLDALRLNEWGGIENWPENFFGDEMAEIAATSKAGLKRRIEAGL